MGLFTHAYYEKDMKEVTDTSIVALLTGGESGKEPCIDKAFRNNTF